MIESTEGAVQLTLDLGYGRFARQYQIPGGDVYHSVTSILGIIAKPALINWAANRERELALSAATELYSDLPAHTEKMSRAAFAASLLSRMGSVKAHQKALEKAQDIGSQAHKLVEWQLRTDIGQLPGKMPAVTEASALAYLKWKEWRDSVELVPKLIEVVVWSRSMQYAGTLDCLAELTHEGRRIMAVLDWKTGKAIYPESSLQASAYASALREMGHVKGELWGMIVRLPKLESDPAFEVKSISPTEIDANMPTFHSACELWSWYVKTQLER